MAPLNPLKKAKKVAPKPSKEEAKPAAAESSSKPAKTLKRKKDTVEAGVTPAEETMPASAPKKAKKEKDSTSTPAPSSTKPAKAAEKSTESVKTKAKAVKETPTVISPPKTKAAAFPVSILKKPKGTPAPAVPKKSKPTEAIPTTISRPRKAKAEPIAPVKSKKTKAPAPVVEESSDEEVEEAEEVKEAEEKSGEESEEDEEEGHLHGFSTDDDDSSDEDAMDDEPTAFDVGSLPTVAKDDATVKWKLDKAKKEKSEDRGVLFLGRLPHGFYEDQLKAYFSQFGNVTRLRVSRNKKTGKSKHYGFIEFDSAAVAQIVADTMDNYLLMGHIMRCKVIPKDQVHPELWVGANRKWRVVPADRVQREAHNKPRTEEQQEKAAKRLLRRQRERKAKLEKAGIKYNFEAVGYKLPAAAKA